MSKLIRCERFISCRSALFKIWIISSGPIGSSTGDESASHAVLCCYKFEAAAWTSKDQQLESKLYPHVLIAICNGQSLSSRYRAKRSDTGALSAVEEANRAGYFHLSTIPYPTLQWNPRQRDPLKLPGAA